MDINPSLEKSGWTVCRLSKNAQAPPARHLAIEEYSVNSGFADYALCIDGQIVGIIEAKRKALDPQEALRQAERYAGDIPGLPFVYSTNGVEIWFRDLRFPHSYSRKISGFHPPSALREMLDRESFFRNENPFAALKKNKDLRDYQHRANLDIEAAILQGKRRMLVAMATGTGKTFMAVNEIYRLMKTGMAGRVLFLVDRRALAAQAVQSFASFEPEPNLKFDQIYEVYSQQFQKDDFDEEKKFDVQVLPRDYLTNPQPKHAFVYVCTIQRMTINLFGREGMMPTVDDEGDAEADELLDIPLHAFNVIIADECHRGYTSREISVWRNTLDHFDAIKIGLTATPAPHTTAYFDEIVAEYRYEDAVREGHLVDWERVDIHSDVRTRGMLLTQGEMVELVNVQSGGRRYDSLDDELPVDVTQIERLATSPDSNLKILEELKKYAVEHERIYHRFPKTLIFAANDVPHRSHADYLVNKARIVFGRGDDFVQKITGKVDRPLQRIREFRNREKIGVVVTVDMLSTGVDIPDLEFIVLLRPLKSRILFEQIIGRGTRKSDNLPDKSHFTVFDCFSGAILELFSGKTSISAVMPTAEPRTIAEIVEDIRQNRDRDYNINLLVKRLRRIDKEVSTEGRELFAGYVPDGDLGRFAGALPQLLLDDFTATMQLLRDPAFQQLLVYYPRPEKNFIIAHAVRDAVASERVIRTLDGQSYKPEDYLRAFRRYVEENREAIDAIGILLDRPQAWSVHALTELRNKLSAANEHFTVDRLQQAHRVQYKKALVEIISMVKHAAKDEEPLLTAPERVQRAFAKVTADQSFSADQQKWLDRIREHLIKNLSIEREDFDLIPIFTNFGGWNRADRDFNGTLDELIHKLNEAIAA
ncbi:MAG TPA: type I restriction-modification enzyme R subunit C-terminal domain-containing protein [bacterium]|nr:type I restriction-modification enzyme R subunit C-terminal domain-containing protein [bacterium]